MTHADVQAWLDRYVEAWETYDEAAVRGLFSEDAEYRYHPWDEPVRGVDAIVRDWLEPGGSADGRDQPGTWTARYEPWIVEGDRAIVIGETGYFGDASRATELRHYWNCWQLEFDPDGRCRSFVEWFMQRRKAT
ncbi:MAG TPA: nuclear transport factor 2 family protein [Candidatus Limnocylindrales bacterium]|nr:nuclear transport factor 2 family protein [Candidatus Limnocylindrales bacterium]